MLVISEHRTSNLYVQDIFWLRNRHSGTLKIGRDRTGATGKKRRLWKPNQKIVPNLWAIVQSIQPSFHLAKNQTVGGTDNSAAKTYWSKCSNLRPLSRVFLSSLPHKHSTFTHSQEIFWQWADTLNTDLPFLDSLRTKGQRTNIKSKAEMQLFMEGRNGTFSEVKAICLVRLYGGNCNIPASYYSRLSWVQD